MFKERWQKKTEVVVPSAQSATGWQTLDSLDLVTWSAQAEHWRREQGGRLGDPKDQNIRTTFTNSYDIAQTFHSILEPGTIPPLSPQP